MYKKVNAQFDQNHTNSVEMQPNVAAKEKCVCNSELSPQNQTFPLFSEQDRRFFTISRDITGFKFIGS